LMLRSCERIVGTSLIFSFTVGFVPSQPLQVSGKMRDQLALIWNWPGYVSRVPRIAASHIATFYAQLKLRTES